MRLVCAGGVKDDRGLIGMVVPYGDICPLGDILTHKCLFNVQNERQMCSKLVSNMSELFSACEKGLYSSIAVQVRISPTLK